MAATVSAWAKPGTWALEAEEQDPAMQKIEFAAPETEFPSLADAANDKVSKKKKKQQQKLSLAEFTAGHAVTHGSGVAANDVDLVLPTGPRERTAEEMERASYRGFGFSSYGGGGGRRGEMEGGWGRWGAGGGSDEPRRERDGMLPQPSRADEVDDWSAGKRPSAPAVGRRERSSGDFFDSKSRADESDSWISNKSTGGTPMAAADGRGIRDGYRERERRGGFEFGRGASDGLGPDAEIWGRRKEGSTNGFGDNGTAHDGEKWGKKEVEVGGGVRPRLVLQPRTLPVDNGNDSKQDEVVVRSKVSNPFGEARPREEVLKEKGQDWKKIDEKLDELKIRPSSREEHGSGRSTSGYGVESRTEGSWRKPDPVAAPSSPSSDKAEESACSSHE